MLCSEKRQEYLKPAYWRELFEFLLIQVKTRCAALVWICETTFGHVTVVTPSLTVSAGHS